MLYICTQHSYFNHSWSVLFDGSADELLAELEYYNQQQLDDDADLYYTVVAA